MTDYTLYQFAISHYNEKARWALDWKTIPHRRISLLPGPHMPRMQRLSGQNQVPVLTHGDQVIAGSDHILAHLEQIPGTKPLLPDDPEQARAALDWQTRLDDEVGPAVRLARFHTVMPNAGYFTSQFTFDQPAAKRIAYRAMFPIVKRVMVKSMSMSDENAARAVARTHEAFDEVARAVDATGYLVGDGFSLADLTAASLLMPAVVPKGSPPNPPPSEEARAWLAQFAEHDGAAWVREMFARHRPPSAEVGT